MNVTFPAINGWGTVNVTFPAINDRGTVNVTFPAINDRGTVTGAKARDTAPVWREQA